MAGRTTRWETHSEDRPMPGLWKNKDGIWQIAKTVKGQRVRMATGTRNYDHAVQRLYSVMHGRDEAKPVPSPEIIGWADTIRTLGKSSWLGVMFTRARNGAIARNIPWSLSIDELRGLLIASEGVCAISGIPFSFDRTNEAWTRAPFAPSLDRIDSTNSYCFENCRIISSVANCALNEWGDGVLLKLAEGIIKRHGHRLPEFL